MADDRCACGRPLNAEEKQYYSGHCESCEQQMHAAMQQDKSPDILLDVRHGDRSIAGFSHTLLYEKLAFHFNGRVDTAELVGCRSFCEQDEDGHPTRLHITLDLKPCAD